MSLRRLELETLDLWQLHRIDSKVPREEQFGVMRDLQEEGKVRHLGLSEVTVEEIEAAGEFFEVATVQNLYNLTERKVRGRARSLRGQRDRLHPVVPARGGQARRPGGARLAARAQPGHAADPPGRARSSTSRRTSRRPSSNWATTSSRG
jgi:pyridoxine 4-dehydrogenase